MDLCIEEITDEQYKRGISSVVFACKCGYYILCIIEEPA